MRPLLEVVRRLLRAFILGARALREPLAAAGALWRRVRLWALGLLPVLLAVSLGRTLFDPTSQGYRTAHPAIGGSWTGQLAASVPPQPRRDPFESEANYGLGLRNWRAEIDAAAADTRGIWVELPQLIISRKVWVTMCAPNEAIARFTTTIDALDDNHLRAILDLSEGPHDLRAREIGNLDLTMSGTVAQASYDVFGSTIRGRLSRGGEAQFKEACARIRTPEKAAGNGH